MKDDIDFDKKNKIYFFLDFIKKFCPPDLPDDDPCSCPEEVNEDCQKCWARWLNSEDKYYNL